MLALIILIVAIIVMIFLVPSDGEGPFDGPFDF